MKGFERRCNRSSSATRRIRSSGCCTPLFGRTSDVGVLLLQPGIHEYERAHWAFRSLASALAARGHHVLRFDYRGTGDSAGEPDDATVEACVEDAQIASQELRESPQVRKVSLVGMRLGAAVAAMAATRGLEVDNLVLWEPVVRGARYLAELETLDAAMRLRLLLSGRQSTDELSGFLFPPAIQQSIARVDLAALGRVDARRVLVFAADVDSEIARLTEALTRAGSAVQVNATGSEAAIARASARQTAVVAGSTVSQIATHIESAMVPPSANAVPVLS